MKFLYWLIGINSDFTSRFCLYYGGKSLGGGDKSSSSTTSTSSTTVNTTNQQVGASEGSTAIGANSTVNIESADPEIFKEAGKVLTTIIPQTTKDALDFGTEALNNIQRTTQSANDLLSRSYETYAMNLKDNTGNAPTTALENSQKNMLYMVYAIAGVGALIGLVMIFRKTSK